MNQMNWVTIEHTLQNEQINIWKHTQHQYSPIVTP